MHVGTASGDQEGNQTDTDTVKWQQEVNTLLCVRGVEAPKPLNAAVSECSLSIGVYLFRWLLKKKRTTGKKGNLECMSWFGSGRGE